MQASIRFRLNGHPTTIDSDGGRRLLWVLRGELALKYGCGAGLCGACTVLIDGKAARACRISLAEVAGKDVVTVEGLARDGQLDALQRAFVDHGALQCGYCTPGMLLSAHALLREHRHPSRQEIAAAMEHNLCRCGAHQRILDAIEAAAGQTGERP
jgi:aerobic-type carbon monoxide dehydrogenase small subunit (CoxS/CutS family)